jgi:Uma2 family endonuclease
MAYIPFDQYAGREQPQPCEWINGALEPLPPLSPEQLRARAKLLALLGEYAEVNELGLVIPGPFAIRMPEEMRVGREPDLLFLPNEFVDAIQDTYVNSHGVGLVVEIADEGTRHRDGVEKFEDYQMAGIPEYWVVDVDRRDAGFYVLQPDNRYHAVVPGADGVYHSSIVKGFQLILSSLWG